MRAVRTTLVIAVCAAVAACDTSTDADGTTPPGALGYVAVTARQRAALDTALAAGSLIPAGGTERKLSTLVVDGLRRADTIAIPALGRTFTMLGVQQVMDFTIQGQPYLRNVQTEVVGWSGLDAGANTLDAWLAVFRADTGTTLPGALDHALPDSAHGLLVDLAAPRLWDFARGRFAVTQVTWENAPVDCTTTIPGLGTVQCRYDYGTMTTTVGWTAVESMDGVDTVVVPAMTRTLPAVRITLSGDLEALPVPVGLRR